MRYKQNHQQFNKSFLSTAAHIFGSRVNPYHLTTYELKFEWWLTAVAQVCLRFSESLNPIFYNIGSR